MWAALLLLTAQVRTVELPRDAPSVVQVECPVNQVTRVVFPERIKSVNGSSREQGAIGLVVTQTKPVGIFEVRPLSYPATAVIKLEGPTREFKVELKSIASVPEVHVPPASAERAAPDPVVAASSPAAAADGNQRPLSPPAASSSRDRPRTLNLEDLLQATPIRIDRKEGMPGQPEMVLEDAFRAEEWIWLRFRLEGGAMSRVERIEWEQGEVTSYLQQPAGKDLRVIVQLPRAPVTKKTRVSVRIEEGATYRFALTARTLTALFRGLLR